MGSFIGIEEMANEVKELRNGVAKAIIGVARIHTNYLLQYGNNDDLEYAINMEMDTLSRVSLRVYNNKTFKGIKEVEIFFHDDFAANQYNLQEIRNNTAQHIQRIGEMKDVLKKYIALNKKSIKK